MPENTYTSPMPESYYVAMMLIGGILFLIYWYFWDRRKDKE